VAAANCLLASLEKHPDFFLADASNIEPLTVAQQYFRIRTHSLNVHATLHQIVSVFRLALHDFSDSTVAATDVNMLLAAMRFTLVSLAHKPVHDLADADSSGGHRSSDASAEPSRSSRIKVNASSDADVWFRRWIIGHQLHAALNVLAEASLRRAMDFLDRNMTDETVQCVGHAAVFVAGFGPARAYALSLPPAFYADVIRPSMLPPFLAVPLSGRLHPEYNSYRQTLNDFLVAVPQPISDLVKAKPQLAFARERLLDADLAEADRHISLVWTMVGSEKSLVQLPKQDDNALGALRKIRDRRMIKHAQYMRFGS